MRRGGLTELLELLELVELAAGLDWTTSSSARGGAGPAALSR